MERIPQILSEVGNLEHKIDQEDAINQHRLAIAVFARINGFGAVEKLNDRESHRKAEDSVWGLWTDQSNGKSFSQLYREFIESEFFQTSPDFLGDIKKIDPEDMLLLKEKQPEFKKVA